ncbi:hypothetical protein LAZ67_6000833 [Cordylochernes scorpioides]|uniref:CUB domain-containing protein n=1 Tax=Cordylochernes scorpioides TaxID=51811 RepID=A0ABY6KIX0_9ARAC|nr:hypothetical protein LAZ67_6000833 [Cordylochernes scorpioides]
MILTRACAPGDILTVFRFQNAPCLGQHNDEGLCIGDTECARRGGTNIGTCARGFNMCCMFKFTCGGVTSTNQTVFVNPNYPGMENGTDTCQVTIEKLENICQLRLDFEEFSLSQPDETGLCTTDSFMVRTTVGERLPILCGENKGQHLYVDMGRGSGNPVVLSVVSNGDRMSRKWKIKISMIECGSLDMAPAGCLQYHRSPSELIRSFNYGPMVEGRVRYLSRLRYTVCIRVEENFCAIRWETEREDGAFSWGQPFDSGASGALCNDDDFVGIDQGSGDGFGPGEDRFCGTKLLDRNTVLLMPDAHLYIGNYVCVLRTEYDAHLTEYDAHLCRCLMPIPRSKPFMLRVKSNGDAAKNAQNSQYGFSLRFVQLPCMI